MADIAVENKEVPVVEEVDAVMAKKIDAVATENGVAGTNDGTGEAKENGSSEIAKVADVAEISPSTAVIADAVNSEITDKTDAVAAIVKEANEASVGSSDGVDSATGVAATIVTDGKADLVESEAVAAAEKSNGEKKDAMDIAEAEPTEETNGDSSTDSPAEAVKRKIVSDVVDAKLDEVAAAATAEKKAKLEEAKDDVTNGGSDPTEVAA